MPGNGLMNDAWLGQTVDPPQTGQTGPAVQAVSWKSYTILARAQKKAGSLRCRKPGLFELVPAVY
jgi:hypothetical protein